MNSPCLRPVDKEVLYPRVPVFSQFIANPKEKHGPGFSRRQVRVQAAGVDYILMRSVSGSNIGPDLGKDAENPSRDVYKTKADVVKLIQQAVADGADLIKQQGDAGLDKTTKFPFGNRLVHNSYTWMFATEHSGEHYGQLVVYYRANNMVPPGSRPR
jgi:hypothetical protein